MLHITNGHSVSLRETALGGDVLVWLDVLHEGPVPADLPLEELSAVRAAFLDGEWPEAERPANAALTARDRTLRAFPDHDEVVLWFEHDLYDQLQLIQLLDFFAAQPIAPVKLSLIQASDYLGPMRPDQLRLLWPDRRAVTADQLDLARRAWTAFRSPDPTMLVSLAGTEDSALPYLAGALRRHLEQFPSTANGLARTERQLLDAVERGPLDFPSMFVAHQAREEPIFMGDTSLCGWAERLAACPRPLLRENAGRWEITSDGRDVLAGRPDHIQLNGIDRWLGGVHLQGREAAWRWDSANGTLVRFVAP